VSVHAKLEKLLLELNITNLM